MGLIGVTPCCGKQRLGPMLGLKSFATATVVIGGIGLAGKIRKHQFRADKLPGRPKTVPAIRALVIAT
jgi:hypothetical protein